ncbi:DUF3352 domain-containing protein [Candidatus Peregrinibacteria bacterium]|nr:DUF3352 domain-containing protein [Candidatus Peregrinibacteria bacterium]
MGRKSSAKKKRRIEETKQPSKKGKISKLKKLKFLKLKKKTAKPAKNQKTTKPKKHLPPQKIFGTLLVLIMATILIVFGVHIFQKTFRPTPLAEFLPAERTSALIEVNTYADHTQLTKIDKLLSNTEYSSESLAMSIQEKFNINFALDIQPWLGRQIGAAEIDADPENPLATVFFLETLSKEATLKALNNIAENNLSTLEEIEADNKKYYSLNLRDKSENRDLDKHFYADFLGNYLILTTDVKAIELLQKEHFTPLSDREEYEDIEDEMPFNKVAFVFINYSVAHDKLVQKYNNITGTSLYSTAKTPFNEVVKAEGLSLIAKDDHLQIESFSKLKEPYLRGNKYLNQSKSYRSKLTKYMPNDSVVFWGGVDAITQIKRLVAVLSEGSQTTTEVFEGVIQNYTEKYLGSSISLEEDVYPLLENEFALAMSRDAAAAEAGKNMYTIILKLEDPGDDTLRLQKIATNFVSTGAVFEPHVVEHELPDGTVAKEIVASPEELIKAEDQYGDVVIYEMATADKSWGVYYAVVDDLAIISTGKESLKDSIKFTTGEATNEFSNVPTIAPGSDDTIYIDTKALFPDINLIKSISAGREYFGDGITAHYYINVE